MTLVRAHIDRTGTTGILLGGGSAVTASDLVVSRTRDLSDDTALGAGVLVLGDGLFTCTRVLLDDNIGVGAWASGAGARVELSDVVVRRTHHGECLRELCLATQPVGLLALTGGAVRAQRFLLDDNGGFGAIVADGQLDLSDGEIAHHVVGINVQDASYELSRVSSRVVFTDNQRKLDAAVVPLPSIPPLPGK